MRPDARPCSGKGLCSGRPAIEPRQALVLGDRGADRVVLATRRLRGGSRLAGALFAEPRPQGLQPRPGSDAVDGHDQASRVKHERLAAKTASSDESCWACRGSGPHRQRRPVRADRVPNDDRVVGLLRSSSLVLLPGRDRSSDCRPFDLPLARGPTLARHRRAAVRLVLPGAAGDQRSLATALVAVAASLLGGILANLFDVGWLIQFLVAVALAAAGSRCSPRPSSAAARPRPPSFEGRVLP